MADYSDLIPGNLKPGAVSGSDLKPGLVTADYAGGTPSAADQIKAGLRNADGSLKAGLLLGDVLKAGIVGESEVINFRAGPYDAPAAENAAAAASASQFPYESLPVESQLTKVEFWSAAAGGGSLSVMIASPSANGWTVSEHQVLTVSAGAGLKTFTVADSSLNPATLPAGSLVGFYTTTAGMMRYRHDYNEAARYFLPGYLYFTGKPSGPAESAGTIAYYYEMQFAWEATATRGARTYAIDESFSGTTRPWNSHYPNSGAAWSFGSGVATPGAAGIANRLLWGYTSNADRQTLQVDFTFTSADGIACIGKEVCLPGASVSHGTLIEADLAANALKIYNPYNTGGTLPTVRFTDALTTLTLAQGVPYRLELIHSGKTITTRITEIGSGDYDEFTHGPDDLHGYAHGRACIFQRTGTVEFNRVRWFMADASPKFVVYGDSITEGSGATNHAECYAELLVSQANGNGWYSGDAGVTAVSCVQAMIHDAQIAMPKYVILYAGANNANSDAERDNFAIDLARFVAKAEAYGMTPIVMRVTPDSDGTKQGRVNVMNAAIVSNGVATIRSDLALGYPDGVTYNASVMASSPHPNSAGHALLAARCLADHPEAF